MTYLRILTNKKDTRAVRIIRTLPDAYWAGQGALSLLFKDGGRQLFQRAAQEIRCFLCPLVSGKLLSARWRFRKPHSQKKNSVTTKHPSHYAELQWIFQLLRKLFGQMSKEQGETFISWIDDQREQTFSFCRSTSESRNTHTGRWKMGTVLLRW